MIYVTDEKNYHALPGFIPLVDESVIARAGARLSELRAEGLNQETVDLFRGGLDTLKTLPSFSYDKIKCFSAVKLGYFRATEPTEDEDEEDIPQEDWGWEQINTVLALGEPFMAFLEKTQKQVEQNSKKPLIAKISQKKLLGFAKQDNLIQSGQWVLQETNEAKDTAKLMHGKAVAVYINGQGFMGRNKTVSSTIASAQTYDSLEAAKRSVKAYKTSYYRGGTYDNITYVEVETTFMNILESTQTVDDKMRGVKSALERKNILSTLSQSGHDAESKKPAARKKI